VFRQRNCGEKTTKKTFDFAENQKFLPKCGRYYVVEPIERPTMAPQVPEKKETPKTSNILILPNIAKIR